MDDDSHKLIEDCFLRPVSDARATNTPVEPPPSKIPLKAELQVLRLNEESQKMIMDTLRSVHGADFELDDPKKYKDRGGRIKKAYWEDRGTLIVQSVSDFSNNESVTPEDRLRQFAVQKLEGYGFAKLHCSEVFDHCECQVDKSLELLFKKYMRLSDVSVPELDMTDAELLEMREDEKAALESIYDAAFEEKQKNAVWLIEVQMENLLRQSPTQKRKFEKLAQELKKKGKPLAKNICRNFSRTGQCRFADKCRFVHQAEVKATSLALPSEEKEEKVFLEVRFPAGTKYPYEPPMLFVKTTCYDVPMEALLKVARKVYQEACSLAADGMPSVYSVSEMLIQIDDDLEKVLKERLGVFPDPQLSIFHVETGTKLGPSGQREVLPSHYEKGSTAQSDRKALSSDQVQKEDQRIVKKFLDTQNEPGYQKMIQQRHKLPAWSKMMEILEMIQDSPVVVISGETGCGKSTQVPQFILDNWLYEASQKNSGQVPHVEVVCTQPRRLSAIGVAERVSDERCEKVGNTVGYQIRLENKVSNSTRLTFCTTGILLRRLQSDPMLRSVTHIIVDEVHERSEESDFLLLILKGLLRKRSDLKVILMSATLNASLFSDYFGGAPVLDIPGRTFPVEQLFLEDILESCGFVMEPDAKNAKKLEKLMREVDSADVQAANAAPPKSIKDEALNLAALYARYADYSKLTCKNIFLMEPMRIHTELIEAVLKYIVEGDHEWPREGSVLVFLPGLQEIQSVHEALMDSSTFGRRSGKYLLVPLHSTLTSEEQSLVFRRAPAGQRKIVLSTNIAETSVTIDDCVFVVDCGLMKEKRFDSNRNMESLDLVWESRANAMQRKGRAGRVMPGVCIHLFSSFRFHYHILAQPVPEIHRVPLEQLLLRIKTLSVFKDYNLIEVLGGTLEPPTEENIVSAVNRLQDVGALDLDQSLTPLGHHLSALPVDVRIGKLMLYGAIFQCLDSVLTIAACLSHKSPFVSPFSKRDEAEKKKRHFAILNSDHLTVLQAYKRYLDVGRRSRTAARVYADENFLSCKTMDTIAEVKFQFLELLVSIGFVPVDLPRKRKNAADNIAALTGNSLNINGENNRLLVSLMCAALYPNVVKILSPEKTYTMTAGGAMPKIAQAHELRFKTREDGYVSIHPSSVNSRVATFQSPFLVYQEKVKTSKIFIRESSMVPLIPLVFFAGNDFRIELHGGDFLILLENGWIILKAEDHKTAEMMACLREELVKLLEEKIRDPCLNLLNHENGRKIIQTIVYLVSKD